ncbi:tRNA epoxyqueuosine(34) reductase QueG [Marinibactrum halimedae]|uniref:Epoxyqueuosine reductase n=2 Tax=Marinibactrum halimedae TaxID=1444977 RepID=A0AA37WKS5_9GAMM|nr:tRNA epoxyqueuosine(34) reductase QueG [Marinibactrum halimedae]MCD9459728.1 tRNA epoxyqueuosine(34) reductase QueG [Marinibactrum halimedae]GLS24515.1 epoxyqueuosine reductase [Marinibactrum halimedae]
MTQLMNQIRMWAKEFGFQQVGVSDCDLSDAEDRLKQWLANGFHGDMQWMADHGNKRSRPDELLPGTTRILSFRMDYLPADTDQILILKSPEKAYVSRYTLGRDYHKLIRKRLSTIARKIETYAQQHHPINRTINGTTNRTTNRTTNKTTHDPSSFSHRAFVDSAPVMERPIAEKAGLGWVGKHSLVIHPNAGSWFFLGEIYTNLPLPVNDTLEENRCGECTACLKVCPTDAFTKPYELDARRCISYLTIENKGPIPEEFREPMGNRVFGCDDCQAICPWNKYARFTQEDDFQPRHHLDRADLVDLFTWREEEYLQRTEGSAIRRIGYENWVRNLSIGLGNAPTSESVINALTEKLDDKDRPLPDMVKEHIQWALNQHTVVKQHNPKHRRRRKVADHKW